MHIKIKNDDGETVEMYDDIDDAQERLDELESDEDVEMDLHLVDFT